MKRFCIGIILITAVTMLGMEAHALSLTPADCTVGDCWTTLDNSQPTADAIELLVGTSTDLTMLYKSESGAADGSGYDSGSFASSYNTFFSNSHTDPEDALIEYIGGASIVCPECYLTVKDGHHSPALYAFNISSWNGLDDIVLKGFWPGGGAISNVAIWGVVTSVPEPGTLGMFGSILIGLVALRRRAYK
ncbi:MAG: PEP-CTERM sorting domain-containing protein [Proteobacteria bacterium]|nr:PEP-CTERM sorting domain-containing protein [Pseudomonadota bacterium]